ncbi:hypothetical protein SDC9_175942 [bioreactor metagenome]|uniref:Uncharacterized protein n=1 Tax=bioreactor metagenome TaxID=1076179 RepID=A0A645GQJ5_9ZZZZ
MPEVGTATLVKRMQRGDLADSEVIPVFFHQQQTNLC